MFLSIDVGNTNIVLGWFNKAQEWQSILRLPTHPKRGSAEYEKDVRLFLLENGLHIRDVRTIGISSVVPELNDGLEQFVLHLFQKEPVFIKPSLFEKLKVQTKNPFEIGSDLISNAMAAYTKYGQACIVVDFGTALTFTLINKDGLIEGVNIAPGLKTALTMLSGNTAQLPNVSLVVPSSALGKNTSHAIQAGVVHGFIGMVKENLHAIQQEVPGNYKIIATGGLSGILPALNKYFDAVDKNLTLEGIRLVVEQNQ